MDTKKISNGVLTSLISVGIIGLVTLLAAIYIFMNYTQPGINEDINKRIDSTSIITNNINKQISKDRYVSKQYHKDVVNGIQKIQKSVNDNNKNVELIKNLLTKIQNLLKRC